MGLCRNLINWIYEFILVCWRNPLIGVLIVTTGYFGIAMGLAQYLNAEIGLFTDDRIKKWDDRRSFGFSIAGFIAGWINFLGLYYSAKLTRALDEDNRIKRNNSRQSNFLEAVKLLKDESPSVVSGAIEGLCKLGLEPDARYFQTQFIYWPHLFDKNPICHKKKPPRVIFTSISPIFRTPLVH